MESLNEKKAREIAMPCQGCECEWTKEKMYKQQYCKDCVAQDKFIAAIQAMEWKEQQLIDKVYEAYCKVCGHFAHTTPIETCRQYCQRCEDFKQITKE